MIRVLFVCMGNICRSPMAEAVFQDLVAKAGLQEKIETDSAGTGDWHVNSPAHPGTLAVLKRNHIPYNGRARCLCAEDLNAFDYVITMDDENLCHVQRLQASAHGTAQITPLLDHGKTAKKSGVREVPDPFYSGGFETVFLLVKDGCEGLLQAIRSEHGLASRPD